MVGHHPVDLLGHAAVEGAHSRLDVGDCDPIQGGGQRPGQGRVGVAVDKHGVGLRLGQERSQTLEHAGALLGVGAAVDAQVVIGFGKSQLIEEDAG